MDRFALIATRSSDARLACCPTRASRRAGPYENFLPNAGWSGLARPELQGGAGTRSRAPSAVLRRRAKPGRVRRRWIVDGDAVSQLPSS